MESHIISPEVLMRLTHLGYDELNKPKIYGKE